MSAAQVAMLVVALASIAVDVVLLVRVLAVGRRVRRLEIEELTRPPVVAKPQTSAPSAPWTCPCGVTPRRGTAHVCKGVAS